jgi:hypothetical protein
VISSRAITAMALRRKSCSFLKRSADKSDIKQDNAETSAVKDHSDSYCPGSNTFIEDASVSAMRPHEITSGKIRFILVRALKTAFLYDNKNTAKVQIILTKNNTVFINVPLTFSSGIVYYTV